MGDLLIVLVAIGLFFAVLGVSQTPRNGPLLRSFRSPVGSRRRRIQRRSLARQIEQAHREDAHLPIESADKPDEAARPID